MKWFYCIAIIWSTLHFTSCKDKSVRANNEQEQETPAALQNDKFESRIKSYSRVSNNLVDELYKELAEKTPALKNLAEKIDKYENKPGELREVFYEYDNMSQKYYLSADYKTRNLTDSLLKQEMKNIIETSKNNYAAKTQSLKVLMERIEKNKIAIIDYYNMLKLVKTLPLIEKYQHDNLPSEKDYQHLIKEQEDLLKELKTLRK